MKAVYEIVIKLTLGQEVANANELKDPYSISETACQVLCDAITDLGMVAAYEIDSRTIDAK